MLCGSAQVVRHASWAAAADAGSAGRAATHAVKQLLDCIFFTVHRRWLSAADGVRLLFAMCRILYKQWLHAAGCNGVACTRHQQLLPAFAM